MKAKLLMAVLLLVSSIPTAAADVYVKVDANGNAIGGAIICDAATCGPDSLYSKLTLQPGERYVLQGYGDSGIGNNNPDTEVKVDLDTNEWTVTNTSTPEPTVSTFTPTREPVVVAVVIPPTETTTATIAIPIQISDTSTATSAVVSKIQSLDINQLFALFIEWLKGYLK